MTPRQYSLLMDRRREELLHREMVAAFTTSAVWNAVPVEREKAVLPIDFMPSHRDHEHADMEAEPTEAEHEYNLRVLMAAVQMREAKGQHAEG